MLRALIQLPHKASCSPRAHHPPRLALCNCIAQRNARELEEHLGHRIRQDAWPTYAGVTYLPVNDYLVNEKATLHVDKLPL